jgi:hypothetical protein
MIEMRITPTAKGYAPGAEWHHISERDEVKLFDSKREALAYIRERYGKAKRSPMYRDQTDGPPVKIGWVIGFRNSDCSHYPEKKWLQQDWVQLMEVERKPIRL